MNRILWAVFYALATAGLAILAQVAAPPHGWLHWPALAVTSIGALGYAALCCPLTALRSLWEPLPKPDPAAAAVRLTELAAVFKLTGMRGLEKQAEHARGPLERHGLRLICDGSDRTSLEATLRRLAGGLEAAEREPREAWQALAQGALNSGVIVTIAGLVQQMTGPPEALSAASLAGAMLATFYGLLLGQLVAAPQAARHRRVSRLAALERELWVEGLVLLQHGVHPRLVADRLKALCAQPAARAA